MEIKRTARRHVARLWKERLQALSWMSGHWICAKSIVYGVNEPGLFGQSVCFEVLFQSQSPRAGSIEGGEETAGVGDSF